MLPTILDGNLGIRLFGDGLHFSLVWSFCFVLAWMRFGFCIFVILILINKGRGCRLAVIK